MCVGVSVWLGWGGIREEAEASACYQVAIKLVSYSSTISFDVLVTMWIGVA